MNAARYSQVLLAFWRQRDFASPWGRRAIAALLVVGCAAGLIWLPHDAAWRLPLAMLYLVAVGAWMAISASLQEQNHPTAARCVPGHLRTLRRAALLGWALSTVSGTLLMWAVLPATGLWPVLLLSHGVIAVFLLWSSRLIWLWILLAMLSPLTGVLASRLAPLGLAIAGAWEAQTYPLLLLSLLAQAWLVTAAFDAGGARHQARYAGHMLMRNAMRMQMEGKSNTAAAWGRPVEWLTRPYAHLFAAWQRHLVTRADNHSLRSVMARAAIVLHGQQHWLYQLMGVATLMAIVLTAFTVVFTTMPVNLGEIFRHGALGMGIGLGSMGFNASIALPNALWQSRREQALLSLLPGMPRGSALNRAVAGTQLRHSCMAWLAAGFAMVAIGTAADSPFIICLPLAALPIAVHSLTRRLATMRQPTPMTAVLQIFVIYALAGLGALACQLGAPLWLPAAVLLPLCAALLAWRWRLLTAAPAALPAGRLA